jgi:hypothetical protein
MKDPSYISSQEHASRPPTGRLLPRLSRSFSPRSPFAFFLACFASILLLIACSQPAVAQPEPTDFVITIFSDGSSPDRVGIAYKQEAESPEARKAATAAAQRDMEELARQMGVAPPKVRASYRGGTVGADAELSGLTDWRTGTINLDPLIQTFKRYGHFRVFFFFVGNFPLKSADDVDRPPLRVDATVQGNTVHYEVWIDQSRGVPNPPSYNRPDSGWRQIVGLIAIALVVAVSVFLVVNVILNQRRTEKRKGE